MRAPRLPPVGLRARVTAVFAFGALALSAALALTSYELTRQSLLSERERAAVRALGFDARIVRDGLGAEDPRIQDVLASLDTGELRRPVLIRGGQFFGRSAEEAVTDAVPSALRRIVEEGAPAVQRVDQGEDPSIVVGVPMPDVAASFYEITDLTELQRTLNVLATVLGVAAFSTTIAGAAVGWWASRRVLKPLSEVAGAAVSIASGELSTRVARDRDPDLDTLAVAFNRMVDEVSARSEADRRFAADVSHELRSPLQTLSAAASVLDRRRDSLDGRTTAAVELITEEVARFESLVTDLLELARSDRPAERRPTDLGALARSLVMSRGLPVGVVDASGETTADVDPRRTEQILANLIDNAARHGGGASRVCVQVHEGEVCLEVDDEGPGVPPEERELIFDRFARGRAASARGGTDGTGLGLALVGQHVQAHRGHVLVLDRPGGGARFRVILPPAEP